MTKQEFAEITTRTFSNEDYKKIEFVYAYHPSISETDGKNQIAVLFNLCGMAVIEDMMPRAKKAMELEDQLRLARIEMNRIKNELEELKK